MELVIEKPVVAYDLTQIKRGMLLYGKHSTWSEGKAGFVTSAKEDQLIIQYHPGIGNVTNHFIIPVSEAVDGQWEIRWSADLTEVYKYNGKKPGEIPDADEEQQETEEGAEAEDVAGGTDT